MRAHLIDVDSGPFLDEVRSLFVEYRQSFDLSLCFQNFDQEVRDLPGAYVPPLGRLILALVDGGPAGCVAMKPLGQSVCEMKRLYVRPDYRRLGLGAELVAHVVESARVAGFAAMRLDTVRGAMDPAIALYRSAGFREIPPYYPNPLPNVIYFERNLLI